MKKRLRLIEALDNGFYVKFMQLEIGLLKFGQAVKALVGMVDLLDWNLENRTACHSHLPTQLPIVSGSINECSGHLYQVIILRASKLQVHSSSVSPRPALTNVSACLPSSIALN